MEGLWTSLRRDLPTSCMHITLRVPPCPPPLPPARLQETQTKPEGQIHFFPIIMDGKQVQCGGACAHAFCAGAVSAHIRGPRNFRGGRL